jgi:hypothetical protein
MQFLTKSNQQIAGQPPSFVNNTRALSSKLLQIVAFLCHYSTEEKGLTE